MKRGGLRYDEEWYAEQAAKRSRWTNTGGQRHEAAAGCALSASPLESGNAREATCLTVGHSARNRPGTQQGQLGADAGSIPAPPTKYRNQKTNGYASKKEAARALALKLMQEAGQIRNLEEQVRYLLVPAYKGADGKTIERAAHYIADFRYEEWPSWNPVVEDCKGMRTTEYVLKRKLMLMVHGIRIKET